MNATRICKLDGCEKPTAGHGARGLCATHYHRAFVRGELASHERVQPSYASIEERFFSKVDAGGVCWEWTAGLNARGYGVFGVGRRQNSYAHRWAYMHLVGPIPDGLTLDHLCRNTRCVNPDHLEPVTRAENNRRAHPLWETCKRGHDLADSYVRKNGSRMCRKCHADNERRRKARLPREDTK